MAAEHKTWILTGSPDNFAATRKHGFKLIGMLNARLRAAATQTTA